MERMFPPWIFVSNELLLSSLQDAAACSRGRSESGVHAVESGCFTTRGRNGERVRLARGGQRHAKRSVEKNVRNGRLRTATATGRCWREVVIWWRPSMFELARLNWLLAAVLG